MVEPVELASIPFLAGVPEEELVLWAKVAEIVEIRRRDTLFCPGDDVTHLYLLRSGLVVNCLEAGAAESRMTAIVDAQQPVNICALHPRVRHTSSATALTDVSAVTIPAPQVRDALERGGRLARLLGGYAAAFGSYLADEFIRATTQDVRTRAAVALIRLADTLGTTEIPLSQEQIAGLIGTRRETLALTLGEMRRQRILDTRYRRIRIVNRAALLRETRDTYPTCIPNSVPMPLTGRSALEEG